MRSHLPLVRAMARRYARRREEFDDLVQAGSIGLVKASARFDPDRGVAFATFVAPTVEGEIRRHLRNRGGRRLLAAGLGHDPLDEGSGEPGAERPAAGEELETSENRVLLAGGLRALEPRERRIVFLRFHADMTERQIARTVGISQAHVSRLLAGALAKLRAELTSADAHRDSTENALISGGFEPAEVDVKPDEQPPASDPLPAGPGVRTPRRPSKSRTANGYSGRMLVRMPSELHEQLALAAERDEVSINRYVNEALSGAVDGDDSQDGAAERSHRVSAHGLRVALATNLAIVVLAATAAIVLLVLAVQRGI